MSLDAAEAFFYDDDALDEWSSRVGNLLIRARETNVIVVVDDFFPRDVAESLRDDLRRQPADAWISRDADDDDAENDAAHEFSLCAHARAASLFTRAAFRLSRDDAELYPSFSAARYGTGDGIDAHDDRAVAPVATVGGGEDGEASDGEEVEFHARAFAGVYYLVNDDWDSARDGGALVDLADEGETRVETRFNRFVCFEVPRVHRVEAVRARDRARHSIFGWWYRPATEDEIPSDFYDDNDDEEEEDEDEEQEEDEEKEEDEEDEEHAPKRRRA